MFNYQVLNIPVEMSNDTKTYYSWWTVIVEEYWLNNTACSSAAFIQQCNFPIKKLWGKRKSQKQSLANPSPEKPSTQFLKLWTCQITTQWDIDLVWQPKNEFKFAKEFDQKQIFLLKDGLHNIERQTHVLANVWLWINAMWVTL